MSPEQLRAKAVDHRSDIFSVGTILYEMLTGNRAFRGETDVDTMTAVLREDPPSWCRSEEHTSELQSRQYLVCRLLLEKKKQYICTLRTHRRTTITASGVLSCRQLIGHHSDSRH